jgi:hypothetical protein
MLPYRQKEESASKKEIFGDFHQVVGSENHFGAAAAKAAA